MVVIEVTSDNQVWGDSFVFCQPLARACGLPQHVYVMSDKALWQRGDTFREAH